MVIAYLQNKQLLPFYFIPQVTGVRAYLHIDPGINVRVWESLTDLLIGREGIHVSDISRYGFEDPGMHTHLTCALTE